jgi:hypothetical protein
MANSLSKRLIISPMNPNLSSSSSAAVSIRLVCCIAIAMLLPVLLFAAAPSWWTTQGVLSTGSANDYAAVNQGQVKNIAVKAVAELNTRLAITGSAGPVLNQLAATLSSTTAITNDYTAVNLGQLKTVAAPFFDCLLAIGYQGHPLESGTYPWVGGTSNDYAMANIGQVKNLFSFDVTNSGLLPYLWQLQYFGSLGEDPNAFAEGVPGLTLLQCYQQGINPVDFYNGTSPTLTIISGTNQTGPAGAFLPTPLVVQVTGTTGQALVNAPVTFVVTQGNGSLAPDTSGTSAASASFSLRTGSNGNVTIYFQQPLDAVFTSTVAAYADSSEADFSETTLPDTNSPVAPSTVSSIVQSDGSVQISWQDNSDNENGFTIQQSNDGGATWITTGTAPADATTYTLPVNNSLPVTIGVTQFQTTAASTYGSASSSGASGGTSQAFKLVPVQNYAAIDASAASSSGTPFAVALADDNSFAYSSTDSSNCYAYTLSNGVSTQVNGLSLTSTDGGIIHALAITANGIIYGQEFYPPPNGVGNGNAFSVSNYTISTIHLSGSGSAYWTGLRPTSSGFVGDLSTIGTDYYGLLMANGNVTLFASSTNVQPRGYPTPILSPGGGLFLPFAGNANGWALGQVSGTYYAFDGSNFNSLSGVALAINDSNQIIGNDGSGGWIQNGSGSKTTIKSLIPSDYQPLLSNITASLISNQDANSTVHIVFNATDLNSGSNSDYVLDVITGGSNSVEQISVPAGVSYSAINAHGVLAGLGTLQTSGGGSSGMMQTMVATGADTNPVYSPQVVFTYNQELSTPDVHNYIPAGTVGKPTFKTDLTVSGLLQNYAFGISAKPASTFLPSSGSTDASGALHTTLTTTGTNVTLTVTHGTTVATGIHAMLPAYYRSKFHITGYSTPCEANFSGPKVTSTTQMSGSGSSRKQYNITSPIAAKSDFLGSVAIEGEGYLESGTHVVAINHTEQGTSNPIIVDCTITTDNQKPQGTYAPLVDGQSCAVTASGPIPPHATIYIIEDDDERSADDKVASNEEGGFYHIDLYCGFNKTYADSISKDEHVVLKKSLK